MRQLFKLYATCGGFGNFLKLIYVPQNHI